MVSMAPSPPTPLPQLSLADLKALSVLGQGARGVVFHVVPVAAAAAAPGDSDDDTAGAPVGMALKAMSRAAAAAARHRPGGGGDGGLRRIWFERDVLLALRHPLLPSLRGVVATDAVVGFAMDRCPGGDLKSLRRRWRTGATLPDAVIRFYAAELVLALEHLHGLGVVHRDLKPENVLVQESGHIMLVDFDLATKLPPPPPDDAGPPRSSRHRGRSRSRKAAATTLLACLFPRGAAASPEPTTSRPSPPPSTSGGTASSASSSSCCSCSSSGARTPAKSNSFVGTEDYVAPEIVAGSGHDHAVDWWGLGVVLYEMRYGRTPFRGRSRRDTFRRVLTAAPDLPGPGDDATPLRDLVAGLLEKDPRRRLGARGVRRHAFFRGVDWDRVLDVARPPFIPAPADDGEAAGAEALDVEKVVREAFGSSGAGETPPAVEGGSDDFSMFF